MLSVAQGTNGGSYAGANGALDHDAINQHIYKLKADIKMELRDEFSRDFFHGANGSANAKTNGATKVVTDTLDPPPSIFTPICHPLVEQVTKEVDGHYLQNWGFPTEKAKKKFVAAGFSRVTCLYFPKALDDRIACACSLLTILFLVDDQLEDLSLEAGRAYNESLMPLCRGDVLPDRSVPVQWMMYDLWEEMRACDKVLADTVLEPVFEFMRAQTSSERLTVQGLGPYLRYRQADVGQALLAALMRFSMSLHLTSADFATVAALEKNTGRHISIINDIYSFEKELHSSRTQHAEGAYLCNAVPIFADETDVSVGAAKRALYVLAREWEGRHREMVGEIEGRGGVGGCNGEVSKYMQGLEYHMSGNEIWSRTTRRYADVVS